MLPAPRIRPFQSPLNAMLHATATTGRITRTKVFVWLPILLVPLVAAPAAASPLQGVGPRVFLHTAADVQPEDLGRKQWDALMDQVKARLEEHGLQVETGDWFAAQKAYEAAVQQGEKRDPPGARVMVALTVLVDPQQRYVYSARFELRELGYFPRPQGPGYEAQDQFLHMDLSFFAAGVTTAPDNRIPRWQAVQTGDVASYATPGTVGFAAWDGVTGSVLGEADRFGRAWKSAQ